MWITNVVQPVLALVAAIVLAKVIGQWGRLRRIERLAEVASKMPEHSAARKGLEMRAERQSEALVQRLDAWRLPPVLMAALMVLALVFALFLTTGVVAVGWTGAQFDTVFMTQVAGLQAQYGLPLSKAVTVQILSDVTLLVIFFSVEAVAYYALRWAAPRVQKAVVKWWTTRRPSPPTARSRSKRMGRRPDATLRTPAALP